MSRTGIDAATFAQDLRERAGDGSIDWVNQPIQAAALLDIADMLDENAKLKAEGERLRKLVSYMHRCYVMGHDWGPWCEPEKWFVEEEMRELGIKVPK